MVKIAIWCRHLETSIIGMGSNIPWHVSSDFKRFKRITENKALLVGQTTYESFPNRTLPNRKIYVLTFNESYEVSDKENHFVVNDINKFKDFEQDLYVSGGATIYKLFMSLNEKLMPDIIVDSVYKGDLNPNLTGDKIDITECVKIMNDKYFRISDEYELDNIITSVWVKKGDFVEQSVLKRIIYAIENKGEK